MFSTAESDDYGVSMANGEGPFQVLFACQIPGKTLRGRKHVDELVQVLRRLPADQPRPQLVSDL